MESVERKPLFLAIEPTNHCNLNCEICFSKYTNRPKGYMGMDMFKAIIDEAEEIDVQGASLYYGGEPLMHPQILDMCQYADEHGIRYVLFTNGRLMTPEIAEGLVANHCTKLHFSLDGVGETYTRMRGGSWEEMRKIIEMVRDIRGPRRKPILEANLVAYGQTDEEIRKFVVTMKELVEVVNVEAFMSDVCKWEFSIPQLKAVRAESCNELSTSMSIMWNGDIVPCCSNDALVVGNFNSGGLVKTFNNSKYESLRSNQPCKGCGVLDRPGILSSVQL